MRGDFNLFLLCMNLFQEMNEESYLWPMCAFNVTCIGFLAVLLLNVYAYIMLISFTNVNLFTYL